MITLHGKHYPIVGHAIVSADGMIADRDGLMPHELKNEADWALFQTALDEASVVVLGSKGHRRHPNPSRRRLVFSSVVRDFGQDGEDALASLFNPEGLGIADALDRMDLPEGIVAVTGGRLVFDHFLRLYDEFLLAEVHGFVLPGGIPCFSHGHPRTALAEVGLAPTGVKVIDEANGVTLTRWVAE